jgi:hypothetical protein
MKFATIVVDARRYLRSTADSTDFFAGQAFAK